MPSSTPPSRPAQPGNAVQATLQHALALHQQGQLPQAKALYAQVLAQVPEHVDALHYLGVLLLQTGHAEEGAALLRKAVSLQERHPGLRVNLGNALTMLKRYDEALQHYDQAIALVPSHADAHSNRANALRELGRAAEAVISSEQALRLRPDMAETWNIRGNALRDLLRPVEAIDSHNRALALAPQYAQAYMGRGLARALLKQHDQAIADFRQVVALTPDDATAHSNLGVLLQEQGLHDEAIDVLHQALELAPHDALTHCNLGVVYQEQGQPGQAVAAFRRALSLDPALLKARSNLLFTLSYDDRCTPEQYLTEAREYGARARAPARPFDRWLADQAPRAPSPLRVGLVSGDLRTHPVGMFLENILAHVDPQQIAVMAYPTHLIDDDMSARLRGRCAAWRPITALNDEAAARAIHSDGIHVLIDLSGHTADSRLPLFAWKPAPVQVSWLGYLASTGVAEIDHLLADAVTVPPEHEGHFTEGIWRLPDTVNCFTPPSGGERLPVQPPPVLRHGHITFGTFQNLAKISDAMLALWAEVMKAVPDARLRIQNRRMDQPAARQALMERLNDVGMPCDRVMLHGAIASRDAHLAAHHEVDIILDTSPYNGITTTCEALWMGVPTLTLAGQTLLSRQGASLLSCAGLPDWVAVDTADYVDKAVAKASQPVRLAELRARLRDQVLASPLFDGALFAKRWSAALLAMWAQHTDSR